MTPSFTPRRCSELDRRPGNVSPAKRSWPAERFGLGRQASRRFLIVTSHGGRILLEIAQDLEFELFGCQWVAENGFERARPDGATSEQFGFFAGQCVGYRQLVAIDQSCLNRGAIHYRSFRCPAYAEHLLLSTSNHSRASPENRLVGKEFFGTFKFR